MLDTAFQALVDTIAAQGFQLLATQWAGRTAVYPLVCQNGHRFARHGSRLLTGNTTCLECKADDISKRFFDVLTERDFKCDRDVFHGLTTPHSFTCSKGHAWQVQARKIMEGSGCPRCAIEQRSICNRLPDGLTKLQEISLKRGGRCLSPSYLGMRRRHLWECADGHQWQAVAAKIVEGSWCPHCARARHGEVRRSRDGLERLRAVARSRRGECLDDLYEGANLKYRFRCERGHEWAAVGNLVLGGTWCGRCANLAKRRTLEQMQAIGRERGGRCLSTAYLENQIKLTWQCKLGHVWESSPNNVVNRGAWCPNCFRLRITLNPVLRRRYDAGG